MTIWNLLFYVDLETSSTIKLICVPPHNYGSSPFSAVNSVFLMFSCACQVYVAEVPIIHFCNYYHLMFYHHMCTNMRSIQEGFNSRSQSSSRSIFCLYLFDINLASTPASVQCLTLCHGGGKLWIHIQLQICIWVVTF